MGADFTPALGFVNRRAVRLYDASAGYRLRFRNAVLRTWEATARQQFFTDLNGRLESRQNQIGTEILTESDHDVAVSLINSAEHLTAPFSVPRNTIVPAGHYSWTNIFVHWQTSTAKELSFLSEITCCSYYNGRNVQGHLQANYRPNQYYELQLGYDPSLIRLPAGRVNIHVASLTGILNFTPDMQLGLQAQYDNISESFGFLARYRWEFRPGSDILLALGQSALVPASAPIQPRVTQASFRVTHTLRF